MSFKKDFIWGAATASYQIEGAWDIDGKGMNVWDMFSHKGGTIWRNHNGDTACDHYHRYKEDINLMKQIGIRAYRFSLSWSRLLPDGIGKVNNKGVDFYNRLIDNLPQAGIIPYITLFHWDYPYELYRQGGWLNKDSPLWFSQYTSLVMENYSDRVSNWITFNEMPVFVITGHQQGKHAPGDRLKIKDVTRILHNVLLSHGQSVKIIHSSAQLPPQIGLAQNLEVACPISESEKDITAARKDNFWTEDIQLYKSNWWLDPMVKGYYPDTSIIRLMENDSICIEDDMKIINQPLDFLGLNIYFGYRVKALANGKPQRVPFKPGSPITKFDWAIIPEVLYWGSKFLSERYNLPIIITENGISCHDWISRDGKAHDPQRIDFTSRYLSQLKRAASEGVNIQGYFHWSLLDNFEWAEGYRQRFGLIHVDYETQKRTLKDSAFWYRDVIKSNGEKL